MPSINLGWLKQNLKNMDIQNYPVFVETGTHHGATILPLENDFHELHTIEIEKQLFERVKNKSKKIHFHLGDSSKVLAEICPKIKSNTIFFLDGHFSSCDTGRGDKDVPLYEELNCIMSFLDYNCIIIIDDCRLFGKGPNKGTPGSTNFCLENWEDINTETILKLLHPRLDKYYFCPSHICENDRLIIFLHNNLKAGLPMSQPEDGV